MMLSTIKNRRSASSQESGFTIVEVMVAAIVIAIILSATAIGLTANFRSSLYIENRTKAENLAGDVLAQAQQAPYRQLYVPSPDNLISSTPEIFGPGRCDANYTNVPSGTRLVDSAAQTEDSFTGLAYCTTHRFNSPGAEGGVGTTFYIQTSITWVTNTSGSGYSSESDPSMYPTVNNQYVAKRVTVTIRWQDVASGDGEWHTVTSSAYRTPLTSECLPSTIPLADGMDVPTGCAP